MVFYALTKGLYFFSCPTVVSSPCPGKRMVSSLRV